VTSTGSNFADNTPNRHVLTISSVLQTSNHLVYGKERKQVIEKKSRLSMLKNKTSDAD
jgi:hypothetical protein